MNVLDILSHDRDKPTGKQALAARLNTTERDARRRIAEIRRGGAWVVSLLSGGYYITENPEEWNTFCRQERRRALATFKREAVIPDEQEGKCKH